MRNTHGLARILVERNFLLDEIVEVFVMRLPQILRIRRYSSCELTTIFNAQAFNRRHDKSSATFGVTVPLEPTRDPEIVIHLVRWERWYDCHSRERTVGSN